MADLVLLTPRTPADAAVAQVAPGLVLLPHRVTVLGMDVGALVSRPGREPALVVVDAVTEPATPIRMVTIAPPGSLPGMISLASAPT